MNFYRYLFYKFYIFSEKAPSRWMSEWKSIFVITVLIQYVLFILGVYFTIITKVEIYKGINPLFIFLISLVIFTLNFLVVGVLTDHIYFQREISVGEDTDR